jgi:hypothetical protein
MQECAQGRGCRAAAPQIPQNRNLKNTGFVDIMMSKVFRDFPYSWSQPPKSANDLYIIILKNKLIKFTKNKKLGYCDWVMEHVCAYIGTYI